MHGADLSKDFLRRLESSESTTSKTLPFKEPKKLPMLVLLALV
jgi:hypothetical protein